MSWLKLLERNKSNGNCSIAELNSFFLLLTTVLTSVHKLDSKNYNVATGLKNMIGLLHHLLQSNSLMF